MISATTSNRPRHTRRALAAARAGVWGREWSGGPPRRLTRRAVPSSSSPLRSSGRCSRASRAKKSSDGVADARTLLKPAEIAESANEFSLWRKSAFHHARPDVTASGRVPT
jgi:hypothetical protein